MINHKEARGGNITILNQNKKSPTLGPQYEKCKITIEYKNTLLYQSCQLNHTLI